MNHLVSFQIPLLSVTFPAFRASKWFLLGVNPLVRGKLRLADEIFPAFWTSMLLCCVTFLVFAQIKGIIKTFMTCTTFIHF